MTQDEERLSALAQEEFGQAMLFLEEFIDSGETYTTFKRRPNFHDWLDQHWTSHFEVCDIRIVEEFYDISENKYSTYQYSTCSFIENRGVFYKVVISGWQTGDYQLESCYFIRCENEVACTKEILKIKLEEHSLFNRSNSNCSVSERIQLLEEISSEVLVQQLLTIFTEVLSVETKQSLLRHLNV